MILAAVMSHGQRAVARGQSHGHRDRFPASARAADSRLAVRLKLRLRLGMPVRLRLRIMMVPVRLRLSSDCDPTPWHVDLHMPAVHPEIKSTGKKPHSWHKLY
eukprot:2897544-Rhodomonas_salina.1